MDKLERIIQNVRAHQNATEGPEATKHNKEEYEKLPPAEKLKGLKAVIAQQLRQNFVNAEREERVAVMAEYNKLVEECKKAGDTTEKRIDDETEFAQLFHESATVDLGKLREQVNSALSSNEDPPQNTEDGPKETER